ncbi:MAG: metallophosphoesterase family protein [Thermodesulfobacteriota bacterium]|nr:metallophosphoesterase family protein [Thermodesulfobacteriota bacterium]
MTKYTFISDVHIGSNEARLDDFKEAINNKKNKNIIICGDLFDCGLRGDMRFSQDMTVEESIEEAVNILKGTKRVVGFITGNHEQRIIKETSLDPLKILADRLKKSYMGSWCEIDDIFVTHGLGGAQTVEGEFNRWLKFSSAKYLVKGHTHKLYYHPFPTFSDMRIAIVTGCMKVESDWEMRRGFTCVAGYVRLDISKSWYQSVELVGL